MGYPDLGALVEREGARFRVWAPSVRVLELVLESGDGVESIHPLERKEGGYFEALIPGIEAGARYRLRLDAGRVIPDPASRHQPDGPHGPSRVVDPTTYRWMDRGWRPPPKQSLVFYELHTGTFSPEGTFQGARQRLPHLADLGVNAVELMPIAEFPGRWNWGYDGAALWAPCRAYGDPDDLRALVDEAHRLGLAVVLDVVFNHFGPDGAYAPSFGPFLTDRHTTSWGQAVNLDDQGSPGVRAFFIANALYWLTEFHLDGLRLDATFALRDDSPKHFLLELVEAVKEALPDPARYLIAEDCRNLDQLIRPDHPRGYRLDAVWADDFHHLNRSIVAGDRHGYYMDYPPSTAALARTIEQGWYFTGQYSEHEKENRGTDPRGVPKDRFVFCIQNHDQIGNRANGERLNHDVEPAVFRASSALLLFLPELPLLFMGQEWAASTPFLFFSDHHEELGRLISEGRKQEFKHHPAFAGECPDPQDPATFLGSRLRWEEREKMPHAGVLQLYRDLLAIRRELTGDVQANSPEEGALEVRRDRHQLLVALRPGLELPLDPGSRIAWHSETAVYAENPRPPEVRGSRLHFPAPAAALLRLADPGKQEVRHPQAAGDPRCGDGRPPASREVSATHRSP